MAVPLRHELKFYIRYPQYLTLRSNLRHLLHQDPNAAPEQILQNIRTAVDGFTQDAEQFDDLTMLCLEYLG